LYYLLSISYLNKESYLVQEIFLLDGNLNQNGTLIERNAGLVHVIWYNVTKLRYSS
jgi:hypothetical protein